MGLEHTMDWRSRIIVKGESGEKPEGRQTSQQRDYWNESYENKFWIMLT
jgi:hypothetical protein